MPLSTVPLWHSRQFEQLCYLFCRINNVLVTICICTLLISADLLYKLVIMAVDLCFWQQ